ncbi:MAG TPA: MFS transporter [Oligoflexia bacterium]|nr:MFS transporter [Oligoflexia bacterium]HMR23850.1 MFS transporter [Oligoflexia bacterium]
MKSFADTTHRLDFIKFIVARFFSVISFQIQSLAIAWFIYDLTSDPLSLGYIGLSQFLPMAFFSPYAGTCADKYDKKNIIRTCFFFGTCISFALAGLSYNNNLNQNAIYLLMTALGVVRAFVGAATQSFLPNIVAKNEFSQHVAKTSSAWQIAIIIGPSLGGFLYAYFINAIYMTYLISGVFLFLSLLCFISIESSSISQALSSSFFNQIKEGFIFLKKESRLLGAISLDLFAVLLGGATALLPIYAKDILHVGPQGLGVLKSAPALGATLMAILLSYKPIKRNIGKRMLLAVLCFGLFTLGFALSKSFILSIFFLFCMGASDIISVVTRGTLVQVLTPSNMRGRISAINLMFIGASNELGEFESGITAKWFGTIWAAALGGIGTILIALSWKKLFPSLWNLDELHKEDIQ